MVSTILKQRGSAWELRGQKDWDLPWAFRDEFGLSRLWACRYGLEGYCRRSNKDMKFWKMGVVRWLIFLNRKTYKGMLRHEGKVTGSDGQVPLWSIMEWRPWAFCCWLREAVGGCVGDGTDLSNSVDFCSWEQVEWDGALLQNDTEWPLCYSCTSGLDLSSSM